MASDRADHLQGAYLGALHRETMRRGEECADDPVQTVFVGGGTPTRLGAGGVAAILETLRSAFRVTADCEITVEANPETVDRPMAEGLRRAGVTRLSLGAQSFVDDELRRLGRSHDAATVRAAVSAARWAGIPQVSLDLMFRLPRQTAASWERTLAAALSLDPEHVSAYELVLEEGARLYGPARSGALAMPDDDAAADLYERAIEVLADAGYTHYEVSNWARGKAADGAEVPARACRHNVHTWRGGAYVGLGPGAHSHRRAPVEVRYANVDDVGAYVDRLASGLSPVAWQEAIDSRTAMAETMMLGLRLLGEGVPRRRFAERHHMPLEAAFGPELETLVSDSLVRLDADRCRLTPRGLMVANRVFAAFLA